MNTKWEELITKEQEKFLLHEEEKRLRSEIDPEFLPIKPKFSDNESEKFKPKFFPV